MGIEWMRSSFGWLNEMINKITNEGTEWEIKKLYWWHERTLDYIGWLYAYFSLVLSFYEMAGAAGWYCLMKINKCFARVGFDIVMHSLGLGLVFLKGKEHIGL